MNFSHLFILTFGHIAKDLSSVFGKIAKKNPPPRKQDFHVCLLGVQKLYSQPGVGVLDCGDHDAPQTGRCLKTGTDRHEQVEVGV